MKKISLGQFVALSILVACGQVTFAKRAKRQPGQRLTASTPKPFAMPPALTEQTVSIEQFLSFNKVDFN
jgi:hypothetical protein